MISEHIETAKLWETGDNSGLGLFASLELIIDGQHRENMIVEIQKRLDQVTVHVAMLEVATNELNSLENFLAFTKKSQITIDSVS